MGGRVRSGWWWWRYAAALVVLVASTGSIAYLLRPPPPPPAPPPPPPIEIAGERLEVRSDPIADALDLVRRYARRELVVKLPDGSRHPMQPAALGAEIDRVRLAELVQRALDPKSALARAYRATLAEDPAAVLRLPLPIRIDTKRALSALLAIKDTVDRPATDAMVDLAKRELVPETVGFRLDVYGSLGRIELGLRSGASEVDAAVVEIKPRVLAAQLGNVKFDEVLGWFETRYNRASRYRARTYNLRLAASKLDGTVLLPGEVFDFNEVVGPRDEANGYRVAPVIAQGELVDGIGGGTCQISGTLHGAAFFAGLEVVERAPHTRPSSYIQLGMDAAVAYPSLNFRLRNNFDFPIVLHETVKDEIRDGTKVGVVRAEILGPERKRTVTFFRRVDEFTPFEVEERETDELAKGERELSQRGVPGFKTTVFRIVRDGAYAVRSKTSSEYPATTQIVKVGTGDAKKGKAKDDNHLEYTADEYLVLTQGPKRAGKARDEPDVEMVESRFPGRTGRRGWQKKAGLSVFERQDDGDGEGAEDDGQSG